MQEIGHLDSAFLHIMEEIKVKSINLNDQQVYYLNNSLRTLNIDFASIHVADEKRVHHTCFWNWLCSNGSLRL